MATPSADAAMAGPAAAAGPAAVAPSAAGGGAEELEKKLRREIEQHRVSTSLMMDTRGEQIKKEIGAAAEMLFDNLKVDSAKAAVEIGRIRQDCVSLQAELLRHQNNLELQIGQWQGKLQTRLIELEGQLGTKLSGIDSDLVHQNTKADGIVGQTRRALDQLASRVSALEATVQGKGAGGLCSLE